MNPVGPSCARSPAAPPRIALLACGVFEQPIAHHACGATRIAKVRFLELGLPGEFCARLRENLDAVERMIFDPGLASFQTNRFSA